ncbi:MAG: hypothetical protein SGPRY_014346, partial [Prymnesium sp.]
MPLHPFPRILCRAALRKMSSSPSSFHFRTALRRWLANSRGSADAACLASSPSRLPLSVEVKLRCQHRRWRHALNRLMSHAHTSLNRKLLLRASQRFLLLSLWARWRVWARSHRGLVVRERSVRFSTISMWFRMWRLYTQWGQCCEMAVRAVALKREAHARVRGFRQWVLTSRGRASGRKQLLQAEEVWCARRLSLAFGMCMIASLIGGLLSKGIKAQEGSIRRRVGKGWGQWMGFVSSKAADLSARGAARKAILFRTLGAWREASERCAWRVRSLATSWFEWRRKALLVCLVEWRRDSSLRRTLERALRWRTSLSERQGLSEWRDHTSRLQEREGEGEGWMRLAWCHRMRVEWTALKRAALTGRLQSECALQVSLCCSRRAVETWRGHTRRKLEIRSSLYTALILLRARGSSRVWDAWRVRTAANRAARCGASRLRGSQLLRGLQSWSRFVAQALRVHGAPGGLLVLPRALRAWASMCAVGVLLRDAEQQALVVISKWRLRSAWRGIARTAFHQQRHPHSLIRAARAWCDTLRLRA